MLSDSILLACMDGTVRDLAALRGTYRIVPETREAVRILLDMLKEMNAEAVHILLDEPVSNPGRMKALIADAGEGYPFSKDNGREDIIETLVNLVEGKRLKDISDLPLDLSV